MWFLPPLVYRDKSWRLTLAGSTAHRMALILLGDSVNYGRQLASLLPHDCSLALWAICASGRWRNSAPTSWTELAEWLAAEGIEQLRLRSTDGKLGAEYHAEKLDESAIEACSDQDLPATIRHCIGDPGQWLSKCGDPISCHELLEETSWFPRWLLPANSSFDPPADSPDARELVTCGNSSGMTLGSELADQLANIITKVGHLRRLETKLQKDLEQAKLESLRQLAYGASHEINNPLANIATRAQALLVDEPDPERHRKLAIIVRQAFRAHEMISDMMLFAKPPPLSFSRFPMGALIRQVESEITEEAREREVSLQIDCQEPHPVYADRTQLIVALKALVRNAIEASDNRGEVRIVVEPMDSLGVLRLRVFDQGRGLDSEIRRHMFDPFYSGREAGRGLGFGLSKCWRIAMSHGGTVDGENLPEGGTVFTLTIPAWETDASPMRLDDRHESHPKPPQSVHDWAATKAE